MTQPRTLRSSTATAAASTTLSLLLLLAACAGDVARNDVDDLAANGLDEQPLNLESLDRPGGVQMATSIDGLDERVSPYGGALGLSLVVARLGDQSFSIHYTSGETATYDDDEAEDRVPRSAGFGPRWQSSWAGRFHSTDGRLDDDAHWHRAPYFEYPLVARWRH
jgi:hypothetical protein